MIKCWLRQVNWNVAFTSCHKLPLTLTMSKGADGYHDCCHDDHNDYAGFDCDGNLESNI